MKYHVCLCPELRVKIVNIEAESQKEALEKAEVIFAQQVAENLGDSIKRLYPWNGDGSEEENHLEYAELSEDMFNALVDEKGNEDTYSNSCWYNCESKSEWKPRFPAEEGQDGKKVL